MREIMPGLPDVVRGAAFVVVKVRGHHRHRIAGIEGTNDLRRRAEIVSLNKLTLLCQLGIVVAAPEVWRLPAHKAAGCIGVGRVGRGDQLTDEVGPHRVVVGDAVEQRREIELVQPAVELLAREVGRDELRLRRLAAAVVLFEPARKGIVIGIDPPGQRRDKGAP